MTAVPMLQQEWRRIYFSPNANVALSESESRRSKPSKGV
jgi:hypothetical protein